MCAAIEHSAGMLHSLTVCHSSTRGMSCSHGNTYVHVVLVCNGLVVMDLTCAYIHTYIHTRVSSRIFCLGGKIVCKDYCV